MKWESLDIRQFSSSDYIAAYQHLDDVKRAKVERTRQKKDRLRTVAADALARRMLGKAMGCAPEAVCFAYSENGKPTAIGKYELSISHSENLVVVAIHTGPVGIDVEHIHEVSPRLAKKYFCADENFYIFGHEPHDVDFEQIPRDDVRLRFFEIWTAKEAYLKSIGEGLSHLRTINTTTLPFERHLIENEYLVTIYY
ncbi:MAG: 4'-phosphopantetheinyl transferase superfamily protein [Clostridia bacterium]|nr:4'-phosphopantetheinyl transferase superfamily protein [Clostridia bacterium]